MHLNTNVQGPVRKLLSEQSRVHLLNPLSYLDLIYSLKHASLVITDSGGIQEEAPSFGTPTLVTRAVTERGEAIDAGVSTLCPLENPDLLFEKSLELLQEKTGERSLENPFGDGKTSERTSEILKCFFHQQSH